MIATSDLKILLQDSEELKILKEANYPKEKKHNYYIGANMGTYGTGLSAGIIW